MLDALLGPRANVIAISAEEQVGVLPEMLVVPMKPADGASGSRRVERSSMRSTPPKGLGCFACALGGEDGRTLLVCAAPDFLEANRRQAREAILLTAPVEIPHAGMP